MGRQRADALVPTCPPLSGCQSQGVAEPFWASVSPSVTKVRTVPAWQGCEEAQGLAVRTPVEGAFLL